VPETAVTVIGAGVVGLAVAEALSRTREVVVLERDARHGLETSSRNSEVIHSGLYYPRGSAKARLCLRGNRLLYELCAARGIAHRRIGKIITAAEPGEIRALESLLAHGIGNGVELVRLSASEAKEREPHIRSAGAIFSPSTGILSAHELMDSFLRRARAQGALVQFGARLTGIERIGAGYRLSYEQGGETGSLTSEAVVNAAGLGADEVASQAGIDVREAGYRLHYCKGSYFALRPSLSGLVSHLVYPLPGETSLGLHAVLDVGGRLRFGPDVEYLPDRRLDYAVPESRRAAFADGVRRILPEVKDEDLTPDIAGIRPKLQGPGEAVRDFVIAEESARGLPGFVNLVGIDSPGLTSSPAIAEEVVRLLPL
jgi:L-2-hydroxyglutarate oxidase LhgO